MSQLVKEAQERDDVERILLRSRGYQFGDESGSSQETRLSAKQWLRDQNLIMEERLCGDFDLTYEGQLLAERLQQSRTSGERRWDLVTRAILNAIDAGSLPSSVDQVDGTSVTDSERNLVYDRIEKWQLAKFIKASGHEVI